MIHAKDIAWIQCTCAYSRETSAQASKPYLHTPGDTSSSSSRTYASQKRTNTSFSARRTHMKGLSFLHVYNAETSSTLFGWPFGSASAGRTLGSRLLAATRAAYVTSTPPRNSTVHRRRCHERKLVRRSENLSLLYGLTLDRSTGLFECGADWLLCT